MELTSIISDVAFKEGPKLLDQHLQQGRRIRRTGYWIVGLLVLPAFGWLAFAPLASSVVATGVVKVDLNRAVVQHMEGGTVSVVHVKSASRLTNDPT